jgi:hypothetical protein
MLFISGGNDVVGVGAEGDLGVGLHVKSGDSSATPIASADELIVEGSASAGISILTGNDDNGYLCFGDDGDADIGNINYRHDTNTMRFNANGTEWVNIHSAGVSIGTTETAYANLTQHSDNGIILTDTSSSIFATNQGAPLVVARTNNDTNNRDMIIFNRQGSTQGEISAGGGATNYSSASDYRLKENVTYTWDATTRLKQLKPARFNFIADETNTLRDGFIAHEVSSIVPEAISGEKDAVDENGDIKYQGIDPSKLVPLLVKTIQELETRVKTLEDA